MLWSLPLRTCCSQTCAKVPKRFEILGSLSPRSGTLMDLGLAHPFCRGTLETQDLKIVLCRKTLETQDLKILICSETLKTQDLKILIVARPWKPRTLNFGYVAKTLETQDPKPQNCDVSRLKRPWSLHHSIHNFMLSIVPGSSTGDELGHSDSKNLNSKKYIQLTGPTLPVVGCRW